MPATSGREVVKLSTWKRYSELRLEATSGKLEISKLEIKFADGRSQIVRPDAILEPGSPSLTVDLDGGARSISTIAVFGRGGHRSSFEILGA